MNCTNCGSQLPEKASFCTECGAKVTEESPVMEIENEALEIEASDIENTPAKEAVAEASAEEIPAEEAPTEVLAEEEHSAEEMVSEEPAAEVIAEAVAPESPASSKKHPKLRRAGKIAALTAGFIAASIVIAFVNLWLFPKVIIPNVKYFAANQSYHSGDYKEAARIYSTMPGFKNSRRQCSKAVYALAEDSMELENYKIAIACYNWLGDYEDSAERLDEARKSYGTELFDSGKYFLSACQFEHILESGGEAWESYILAWDMYSKQHGL